MKRALVDVDGVVCCGTPAWVMRPGVELALRVLDIAGYRIYLWSAGGEEHAQDAATRLRAKGVPIAGSFAKPPFPMEATAVMRAIGWLPDLQIDDDPQERIRQDSFAARLTGEHIRPFLHVETFVPPIVNGRVVRP